MTQRSLPIAIVVGAAALALLGCQGTKPNAPERTSTSAGGAARAGSGASGSEIGMDLQRCSELEASVARTAAAAAACTADDECGIIPLPLCDVRGIGCYFAAVSSAQPVAALRRAVDALEQAPCPQASCDCSPPPERASCVQGRCRGVR